MAQLRVQSFALSLGSGEHLLQGIDLRALGYVCAEPIAGERATHFVLRKRR